VKSLPDSKARLSWALLFCIVTASVVTLSINPGWALENRSVDDNRKTTLLTAALGGASATWAYSGCGFIGSAADGYAAGLYSDRQVIAQMDFLLAVLKKQKRQLESLDQEVDLGAEDEKFIKQLVQTLDALISQGQHLVGYISTRKQEHLKGYHQSRVRAWQLTVKVLGLSKSYAEQRAPGGAKLGG